MGKQVEYAAALRRLEHWDPYLLEHSGLPGPRGNLELAHAAAEQIDEARIRRYLEFGPDVAPTNDPHEYLCFVGVLGLGVSAAGGRPELLHEIRGWAGDPRWRVREAVAMALQRVGDVDPDLLVKTARSWATGTRFEQRAAVAGIAETRLLARAATAQAALEILDQVTAGLMLGEDERSAGYSALRKALGYGWSVVIAAAPDDGKARFESWVQVGHPQVRWVVRENLKKARLARMDPGWVARMAAAVG